MTGDPEGTTPSPESQGSKEKEFKPSWLIKSQDELNKLRKGEVGGTPGKRIAMLHSSGLVNTLNADQLSDRVMQWGEEAVGEGDEVMEQTVSYFVTMTDRVQELREGKKESKSQLDEAFPSLTEPVKAAAITVGAAILSEGIDAGQVVAGKVVDKAKEFLGRNKQAKATQGAADAGGGSGRKDPPSGGGNSGGRADQEPSNEGDKFSKLSFAELQSQQKIKNLSKEDKEAIQKEIDKLVDEFSQYEVDGEKFLDRMSRRALETIRFNPWDKVYNEMVRLGDNLETELKQVGGDNPRWAGIAKRTVESEAARVVLAGVDEKKRTDMKGFNVEWLTNHGYLGRLDQLQDSVDRGIFQLVPDAPAPLVGSEIPGTERTYRKAGGVSEQDALDQETLQDQMNRMLRERMRGATQIPPKEIVALFKQGRYGNFEDEWSGKVEFLDVTKEEDRKRWILLNMSVFNDGTIPNPAMRWQQVLETWLGDIKDAERLAGVDRVKQKEIDESYKDMVAIMAISASARAFEDSEGDPSRYGKVLSGSGEKPDLGIQDRIGSLLLHNDPDKINRVLKRFGLIERFYKRTLDDAGITVKEWGNGSPSRVTLRSITNQNVAGDVLAFYLEKGNGGFDGYADFLLNKDKGMKNDARLEAAKASGVTNREVSSMAKIATDIFLVDNFSRWVYLMNTKGWKTQLSPVENYGGDPLRVLLEPAFLSDKIKKVYQKSPVLRLINSAFRPLDIFHSDDLPNLPQRNKDELRNVELVASMATHFKFYMRFTEAVGNVLGSSQAAGIGDWSDRSFESLASVPELLNQVYGGFKLSVLDQQGRVVHGQRDEDNPDRTGKEIVGAMVARVILAKAQALAEKAAEPTFWETVGRTVTEPGDRDPFEKILQTLWGPNKDGRAGFLYEEASTRLELVMDNRNRFGAAEDLAEAKRILQTRSKTPRGQSQAGLMAAGQLAVRMLASANELRGRR